MLVLPWQMANFGGFSSHVLWTAYFSVNFLNLVPFAVVPALHSISEWRCVCRSPLPIEIVLRFLAVLVLSDELEMIGNDREVVVFLLLFRG
jgi:tRNA threonylcarbamoyladenosine modification (KEOPS) complex Cgi121 subunit